MKRHPFQTIGQETTDSKLYYFHCEDTALELGPP